MSESSPKPTLQSIDWRTRVATTLTKDVPPTSSGAPAHKAGSIVRQVTVTKGNDGQYFDFVTPSASAMSLAIALENAERATVCRERIAFSDVVTPFGPGKSVTDESISELYEYFQSYFAAVVFSFLALEVFANEVISQHPKKTVKTDRGSCGKKREVELRAEQLESKSSTEEKLAVVLPTILGTATPRGRAPWEAFKELQRARNEVMHLKAKDSNPRVERPEQLEHGTLLARAFDEDVWKLPKAAVEMIGYFAVPTLEPKWLEHAASIVDARSAHKRPRQ